MLPGTIGRTAHDWQRSRQPTRLLYGPPTATIRRWRVTLDEQGCHHLPPTSSNHGIGHHSNVTFNPDTMSALMITTLASRKDIRLYQEL
jgi:hypothetical protein